MFNAARQTLFIFKKDFGDSQALQFCYKESKWEEVKCLAHGHGRGRPRSESYLLGVKPVTPLSGGYFLLCYSTEGNAGQKCNKISHFSG